MDITLPRETSEFVPVPVYQLEVLVTDFEVAITRWPERPSAWTPAAIRNGEAGVVAAGLVHGTHQVWVRVGGSVIVAAGTIWVD